MSKHVVIDLEMCNVPRGFKREAYNYSNEVIQIGAVVVDEALQITDEFMTYVSPEFGTIDLFIEKLTGITRKAVQDSPHFKEAMEMFLAWLPDDAVLVSWSDNDKKQIQRETEAKGLFIEGLGVHLDNWVDCQKSFSEKMDSLKNYKLSEALIIADITCDSGEHDALLDARNTAKLFIKLENESELVLNPYYSQQSEQMTYNPFAVLLANYNMAG